MTLFRSDAFELARLMKGTSAGAQIPEIVRRGLQDLLEAGVSAAIGAQRHQRCPEERSTHRNGYRERVLTTQVSDLTLAIPKLRHACFLPTRLEPRRRVDKALYAVVMEASTGCISTRKVDALVEALSGTIKCMFQRCAWQRCRVHVRCKQLPNAVPIMDTARNDVLLIDSCATYLR
jgi:transposase-like protein